MNQIAPLRLKLIPVQFVRNSWGIIPPMCMTVVMFYVVSMNEHIIMSPFSFVGKGKKKSPFLLRPQGSLLNFLNTRVTKGSLLKFEDFSKNMFRSPRCGDFIWWYFKNKYQKVLHLFL